MNILYISSKKRWGGIVSWMQRTAVGLEERGHRVWIVTHPDCRFTRSTEEKLRLIPRRLGMDFNPLAIGFLVRFIKRHRIDLVVTNIQKELLAGGIAARLSGIPNVRRIGNELDLNNKYRRRQRLLVDHTIVPCDAVLKNAMKRSNWLEPAEFTTIYNGRNVKSYAGDEIEEERRRWGLSKDDVVIGSTSQLTTSKRLDRLIHVFSRVLERHPSCRLVITGEGPERKNLEALSVKLETSDRVVFPGFTSDAMRTAASYDIAVSNSAIEGFPNSVVEYFAAGTPVLATDVGGTGEMVKDGKNGILIEPENDDQLLKALLFLIENPDARARLSQAALETIRSGFSEDLMIERLEELFQRVVAQRKR